MLRASFNTLQSFVTQDDQMIDTSTFPPLITVVETFLLFTSGDLNVTFQEAFCNGSNFSIYDNDVFIQTVSTPGDHFCGINTSSYKPIVSPTFAFYNYILIAGQHNLTVVIPGSPLIDGSTSLIVTMAPIDPNTKYHIYSRIRRALVTR